MDLDSQIQTLVKEAPNDGVTSDAVIAIAPALKAIASQLKHPQYYILQTLDQSWVMTSLSSKKHHLRLSNLERCRSRSPSC